MSKNTEFLKTLIEKLGYKDVSVRYQNYSDSIEMQGGVSGYYAGVNGEPVSDYLGYNVITAKQSIIRYYAAKAQPLESAAADDNFSSAPSNKGTVSK